MSKKINKASFMDVVPPKGLEKVVNAFFSESDRGFLIVSCAFIEEQMDIVLGNKLAKQLSSFHLKTAVISEFFLSSKLTQIIIALGKLRNNAAHSTDLFLFDSKDPNFKTNIVTKMKNHKLFKAVQNIEVTLNGVAGITSGSKMKLGSLLSTIDKSKHNRSDMLICIIAIAVYLKALNENALIPLKKHKFEFA